MFRECFPLFFQKEQIFSGPLLLMGNIKLNEPSTGIVGWTIQLLPARGLLAILSASTVVLNALGLQEECFPMD
jgi:hypothetical protein